MPQKPEQSHVFQSGSGEPPPERDAMPPNGQSPIPWRLVLQFENGKRTVIDFGASPRVVVGRAEAGDAGEVSLDLTPFGGAQSGVSRVHAAFAQQDDMVYLEDLGSSNGTRINGFPLTANQAYRLRDNDEVEFGSARVVARLVRPRR